MSLELNISAYNSIERISEIKSHFGAKKILLVTGRSSYKACGAKDIIEKNLSPNEYIRFSNFEVNPKLEDGIRGTQLAKEANVGLVLAIGGGSVIDMAKMIKGFLGSPNEAENLIRGKKSVIDINIPLIAVPTTAGSGSEATHFAVVYIGKDKFSLAASCLLPNMVVLDGSLLKSASSYQKAINGLDALAQAIEGCWAVSSTQECRDYAFEAIKLLVTHLPKIINSNNEIDLQNVMLASNLAGKTINIAKSTAPHAFSYAFTSYHNIPHGHAVWLTLPEIFSLHNSAKENNITDPRGAEYFHDVMSQLKDVLGIKNDRNCASYLRKFMNDLGVEPDMSKLGVMSNEQRKFVASRVNLERFANNPMVIEKSEIIQIFHL